ncbi:MFS transporter [Aeromicrobium sp. Root344]|uniref:MFS transporter n=1 Tax=Aeromicrobium sp. Root344 TaxID=1736521 RepID=UPI0006FB8E34|nr:MFS transporter [Aeromicrobium sp. Root344]KQV76092.1 MFS transporter [Aeromicrobium sp. Root344]
MTSLSGGRAFAALAYAFAVTMMGTTLPTPMYVIYQGRFGFSITMSTVIFATYAFGVLAALLAFGRWSDALGRRPLLLAGLGAAIASDVVFLLAGNTGALLVGRVLSGLSAGIFVGTATAAVVEAAPAGWRSRAALLATAANIGGLGLGPLVAGALVDWLPWDVHLAFLVHLGLSLIAVALVWWVAETVDVVPGSRPSFQRLAVPAKVRTTFVAAGTASFAGFAVMGLFVAVSPRFVAQALTSPSPAFEGLVVFTVFGASVIAQVALRGLPTTRAVNAGCALLVVGMLVLVWGLQTESVPLMLVAAVAAGSGQGLSFSKGLASVLAKVDPHERAGVTSAFFVVAYVAISLPVIGEGVAAQHWGLTSAGTSFSAAVAALAALALISLVIDQRRDRSA